VAGAVVTLPFAVFALVEAEVVGVVGVDDVVATVFELLLVEVIGEGVVLERWFYDVELLDAPRRHFAPLLILLFVLVAACLFQFPLLPKNPVFETVSDAGMPGLAKGEFRKEVDCMEVGLVEENGEGSFEVGDTLEEIEDVQLLQHFLAAVVVLLNAGPAGGALEVAEQTVGELAEEVEEVVAAVAAIWRLPL
jgi:hypothetical protein